MNVAPDETHDPQHSAAQNIYRHFSEAMYGIASDVASTLTETLPKVDEMFSSKVLLIVGGTATGPLGSFAREKWRQDSDRYDELHINTGHARYSAMTVRDQSEDILDTIIHELVHLYARERGIKDTSGRRNRYHNKQFGLLAMRAGLKVVNSQRSHIGYTTVGLSSASAIKHAPLIARIENALRLNSAPLSTFSDTEEDGGGQETPVDTPLQSKYIFARCSCRDTRGRFRTIRIARGWWESGTIGCATCRSVFSETRPEPANALATA